MQISTTAHLAGSGSGIGTIFLLHSSPYLNTQYIHSIMYILYKNLQSFPGAKVRVITREARYYAKTRAFASFYAIISRAHAARAVT